MKTVEVTTRSEWRHWLAANHDKEPNGIWLVYRKQFIWWIVTAKRPETREKRLKESLMLLTKGEKPGMR